MLISSNFFRQDDVASEEEVKSDGEHAQPSSDAEDKISSLTEGNKTDGGKSEPSSSSVGSFPKQYATRGSIYRPRGRGRGRPPGRAYGMGRRPLEQSTSGVVSSSYSKDTGRSPSLKAESKVNFY